MLGHERIPSKARNVAKRRLVECEKFCSRWCGEVVRCDVVLIASQHLIHKHSICQLAFRKLCRFGAVAEQIESDEIQVFLVDCCNLPDAGYNYLVRLGYTLSEVILIFVSFR